MAGKGIVIPVHFALHPLDLIIFQSALSSFYGIGPRHTQRLMSKLYIHDTARVGSLADKQVLDLTAELSNMTIENDLRRKLQDNIRRLRDMGAYRGRRHAMQMPVRGQRTRTQVCRLTNQWLPRANVCQDCHRRKTKQSREVRIDMEPVTLQHFHGSARLIGAPDDHLGPSRVSLQTSSTTFTERTGLWCNRTCALASIDLDSLVLTCTNYAYVRIPEYSEDLHPITRSPRHTTNTFSTDTIHALPYPTFFVRLGRSYIPNAACPVVAPTS
ncbi:MAG: hypothetical protein L6R36_001751 [Xanthoria steineri]|nr:MAG: hypothetical protein L6R36_001751 [Xanthoria steineri]